MPNRIYLKTLQSIGKEKISEVIFEKGLNIISGASNTGKSYVVQCIDYMLGSSEIPDDIIESNDYKYLLLEMATSFNKTFTIKRNIRGDNTNTIFVYEAPIKNMCDVKPLEMGINAKSKESISKYILTLLNLDKKKILTKKTTGTTKFISLRALINFIIVDENSIISKKSPLLSDKDSYNESEKKSTFRLLLTGVDDMDIKEVENPEIHKAKLNAQIELYERLISKVSQELRELGNSFIKDDLNTQKNSLINQYLNNTTLINQKVKERNLLIKRKDELNDTLIENTRLLSRYNLLKEYYTNDIERLGFLEEGSFLLNQLANVPCPICQNSSIPNKEDFEIIIKSCNEELNKNKNKIVDLDETIVNISEIIKKTSTEITDIFTYIDNITLGIENELKPHSDILKNNIQKILDLQKEIDTKAALKNNIEEYTNSRNSCQAALKNYKSINISNEIGKNFYNDFTEKISKLLNNWKYSEDSKIIFNEKKCDIEIDGKPRGHLGKGHRALTRAAFVIGLMEYIKSNDIDFLGFVILDSPLLSLKEVESADERVSDQVQNAFWDNLSNISDEKQIIIIENKEPDDIIKCKANFIKFTGSNTDGRKGFY